MSAVPNLRLVHSDELTGVEEQDLVAYINFADGIRCNLGVAINSLEQYGAMGIGSGSDPEDAMVRAIDRKTTFRRSHQVMLAIGEHARSLTNTYLIYRKPAGVESYFGKLAGLVLAKAADVEGLTLMCRRESMKTATKADKKALAELADAADKMYRLAARTYATVLRSLPSRQSFEPPEYQKRESPRHICREGGTHERHICPCDQPNGAEPNRD